MTPASSIISALGTGSGVDMAALATNLATAQFQFRTDTLTQRSEVLERQISTASSLKNSLSLLASALGDRVRTGDLAVTPRVANAAVATASSPGGLAGKGSYSLEVTALAKGQTLASPGYADPATTFGGGSLTIRLGTISSGAFAADPDQTAIAVTVPANATLDTIASAIRSQGRGIDAYVAQTPEGAKLVLKGAEGAAKAFTIETADDPAGTGTTLAGLAWQPSTGDTGRRLANASDAQFLLDGLARTAPSNNVGVVAPGLSLTLTATNVGAPTTISFSSPGTALTTVMQDLVSALNEVAGDLRTATDPLSGDLARDSGARALRRTLSGLGTEIILPGAPQDAPRTLSDLGLAIERDGTFRLDAARLQATLARDPDGVAAMFTPGLNGVFATFDRISRAASRTGDPGSLGGSIARYQNQSKQISAETAKIAEQQERLRASLTARFAKADAQVGASKSTLTFLQAQIDAWNSSRD